MRLRNAPPHVADLHRRAILDAANARRQREQPYRAKNIQQAVHRCVQLRLVTPAVLHSAGFRGAARRLAQVTSAQRGGALRRHAHARARRQYERARGAA